MVYHYESHTTTTDHMDGTQTRSSVIVRELDEGEVGILLAGNNSIVDPSLTPRMLSVSTTDYDVENVALSPSPYEDTDDINTTDEDDDNWFPSLQHNSWIEGLDDDNNNNSDDDDIMVEKMVENLFATAIMEKDDDDDDGGGRRSKTRNDGRGAAGPFGRQQSKSKRTQSSSREETWMDEDSEDDCLVRLVPVNIIYVMLND